MRKEQRRSEKGVGGFMPCRWSRHVHHLAAKCYVWVLREPGHDIRAKEHGDGRESFSFRSSGVTTVNFF